MLLAVDAGNSMVKYGVFSGEKLVARFAAPNELQSTTLANVQAWLSEIAGSGVSTVAVACVGPHADALMGALDSLSPGELVRLHSGLDLGLVNAYEQPARVGIDRLLNVLAAHNLYGGPAVVADIGTATNFECVGAQGEFFGGAICAGPQLSLDALGARSPQLLRLQFDKPNSLIATNTSDALKSGAFYGHAKLVDGLLQEFRRALGAHVAKAEMAKVQANDTPPMGTPCKTIVTGGYAEALAPFIPSATHVDPDLTLHGVRLAFERISRPTTTT